MKTRKVTKHVADLCGVECSLHFEPCEWIDSHAEKVVDRIVVAYCVQDDMYRDVDDLIGDCMGKHYRLAERGGSYSSSTEAFAYLGMDKWEEPIGAGEHFGVAVPDKDAVILHDWGRDGVMQVSADQTYGHFASAVWMPDKCLLDQLNADEAAGQDRRVKALMYAAQYCTMHEDIVTGNVYGCVVEVFDMEGNAVGEPESCWGFIGAGHAEEALKSEFFNPTVKRLMKEKT